MSVTGITKPISFFRKLISLILFNLESHLISWLCNTGNSSANVKDSLMNAESPEFWCQNSLLKLQSLLCCNLCKGASCKSIVQGYLDIKPGIVMKILLLIWQMFGSIYK